ncbi:MAG: hypothetical protein ABSB59_42410, partial [Streptosporangiaceae bacterium]
MTVAYAPGSLVTARGREWVVLPDSEPDMLVLRPLAGTDEEVAAVFPSPSFLAKLILWLFAQVRLCAGWLGAYDLTAGCPALESEDL